MIKQFLILISLAMLALSPVVYSNQAVEAIEQIQKMSDAMHNKSYSGDFVYLHGTQLESMSIQHVQTKEGLKERLFSLNGEAHEVFRDNENLTCVCPNSKKIVQGSSRKVSFSPLWIPDDVKRLAKFYSFKIVGMGRVADRLSQVVLIQPKDDMRYGMQIWVDQKDGFLLKSTLLNSKGDVLEQVMFTQINELSNPELTGMDLVPTMDKGYELVSSHPSTQDNRMMLDSAWKIETIPVGFWMESAYKKPSSTDKSFVHHMIFTDGLSSLSLFIERQTNDSLMGSSSMGAINAYGMVVNGYSVTAVGGVPPTTVKKLVSSIYYQ